MYNTVYTKVACVLLSVCFFAPIPIPVSKEVDLIKHPIKKFGLTLNHDSDLFPYIIEISNNIFTARYIGDGYPVLFTKSKVTGRCYTYKKCLVLENVNIGYIIYIFPEIVTGHTNVYKCTILHSYSGNKIQDEWFLIRLK